MPDQQWRMLAKGQYYSMPGKRDIFLCVSWLFLPETPKWKQKHFFQLQESLSSYVFISWWVFYDFVFGVDHFVAQDTFRGRICVCPLVEGVQFEGDGYSNCQGNNIAQFMTYLPTYLMSFILSFVYFPWLTIRPSYYCPQKRFNCLKFMNVETATGPGRCRVDNTGCWIETQGGLTFSACQVLSTLTPNVFIWVLYSKL
jgi:hypothetical protein